MLKTPHYGFPEFMQFDPRKTNVHTSTDSQAILVWVVQNTLLFWHVDIVTFKLKFKYLLKVVKDRCYLFEQVYTMVNWHNKKETSRETVRKFTFHIFVFCYF